MVFHLASTSLAIVFANIYSPNIRSFSFKIAFHYIILCRYYKTYIAPTGDTNIRAPDTLPENVRRYLCGALGVSDERIEFAWSAPSFRDYIWKSYNSRTETQMSERIIYKARKRGIEFGEYLRLRELVDYNGIISPSKTRTSELASDVKAPTCHGCIRRCQSLWRMGICAIMAAGTLKLVTVGTSFSRHKGSSPRVEFESRIRQL